MENIKIETEFIRLDQFLKYIGVADTGGVAKILIAEEYIKVNDEICTQRGKKLRSDDIIEVSEHGKYRVVMNN